MVPDRSSPCDLLPRERWITPDAITSWHRLPEGIDGHLSQLRRFVLMAIPSGSRTPLLAALLRFGGCGNNSRRQFCKRLLTDEGRISSRAQTFCALAQTSGLYRWTTTAARHAGKRALGTQSAMIGSHLFGTRSVEEPVELPRSSARRPDDYGAQGRRPTITSGDALVGAAIAPA